ncbi:hypothetical protein OIDMADRAFT_51095 [Oidiodendron maius Zn]|uniref:2EXR domain-containing protein n=1 Tax=Oidiodendron maius (strain Zn) TaxID=913774 RepID=A0A0C3HQI9_OIDMZ|nr:hypothetical protein OIDMADRAFT_51095 [Oidiodendron maius Zn]
MPRKARIKSTAAFHPFPRLPPELRLRIWAEAMRCGTSRVIAVNLGMEVNIGVVKCRRQQHEPLCGIPEHKNNQDATHEARYMGGIVCDEDARGVAARLSTLIKTISLVSRDAHCAVLTCYPYSMRLRQPSRYIRVPHGELGMSCIRSIPAHYRDVRCNPAVDVLFVTPFQRARVSILKDSCFEPEYGVENFQGGVRSNKCEELPGPGSALYNNLKQVLANFQQVIVGWGHLYLDNAFAEGTFENGTADLLSFMPSLKQVYICPWIDRRPWAFDAVLKWDTLDSVDWNIIAHAFKDRTREEIPRLQSDTLTVSAMLKAKLERIWADARLETAKENGWMPTETRMPQFGIWASACYRDRFGRARRRI